ncbi:MAG TPA: hypothetical protein VFI95_12125, partial [Terriglobales bacterium]|nr:hypothetical protein [Terriglobales bacterium]
IQRSFAITWQFSWLQPVLDVSNPDSFQARRVSHRAILEQFDIQKVLSAAIEFETSTCRLKAE